MRAFIPISKGKSTSSGGFELRYANRASFLNQIKSAAAADSLCRVYWVGLAQDYERQQIFNEILRYVLTPDCSMLRWSGADLNFSSIYDHLKTPSLFGGEPVALLDEAEKISKSQISELQKLLSLTFGYLIIGSRSKSFLSETVEKEGVVLDLLGEKPWERERRIQQQLEQAVKNAGKSVSSEALSLLLERHDLDAGVLEREIEKAICYVGERAYIDVNDIEAICSSNKSFALWQTAEQIVWEGIGAPNEDFFHSLIPALRAQLQLGLKIASLLDSDASREEWNEALPKIYPRTLEKRTPMAQRLGVRYFIRGLETLFDIELSSRTGSQRYGALLDFFRCKLISR